MAETESKKKKVFDIIWIACIFAGFGFTLLVEYIPYVPAGNVIDEKFLNTLKWMIVLKYLVPVVAFAMLFGSVFVHWFKNGDKSRKALVLILTSVVAIAVVVVLVLTGKRAVKGFVETPVTYVQTVSDMNYSSTGMTYTVDFTDGSYAHVSNYQYKQISVGKDVYVVYCDDVAIGVFPTSRYKLG